MGMDQAQKLEIQRFIIAPGQVIYVDRFGNLVSNIPGQTAQQLYDNLPSVRAICAGRDVGPLQGTYGFVGAGEPLALVNSMGLIEVAVNRGRACDVLSAGIGAEIRLRPA